MPKFLLVMCIQQVYVVYLLLLLYYGAGSLGALMYLETKTAASSQSFSSAASKSSRCF